jgi:hypothetical protein
MLGRLGCAQSLLQSTLSSPLSPNDGLAEGVEVAIAAEGILNLLVTLGAMHVFALDHVLIGSHRADTVGDACKFALV